MVLSIRKEHLFNRICMKCNCFSIDGAVIYKQTDAIESGANMSVCVIRIHLISSHRFALKNSTLVIAPFSIVSTTTLVSNQNCFLSKFYRDNHKFHHRRHQKSHKSPQHLIQLTHKRQTIIVFLVKQTNSENGFF